jgi:hypothetical protein
MTDRDRYTPGPARGAQVRNDGEKWTLILVRELRHSPEKVWQALTDPAHLREWAPFDADGSLGTVGTVKLTTVGAPAPQVEQTRVTPLHSLDRRFISMGDAGWHICFDVPDRLLSGTPIGRIVAGEAMKFGWARLNPEYARQFDIETPNWPPQLDRNS